FEQTHPWLTFSVELAKAPASLWVKLGECQSKCQHIAGVPLRPATARQLHLLYLAKGSLATTAIEGNTLSEQQVLQLLQGKLRLPPSQQYLAKEIENIRVGCERIVEHMQAAERASLETAGTKELNRIVLTNLELEPGVVPGQIRTYEVGVARYRAAPAEDCAYLLQRLCDWLNGETFRAPLGMTIVYAIVKAMLAHIYLAWIHPFGDGNGRTARLVELQILVSSAVPTPAAHMLSNHYNQTRTEYYRQLDVATRSGGDVIPFLMYAVDGFLDGLRSQLEIIRQQQWDVAWRNYVHECFRDRTTASEVRRRHLVLDLSRSSEPVPISELPELSTRLAAAYAGKTRKTLTRDVRALQAMGLLAADKRGVWARRELIRGFLPVTAVQDQQDESSGLPEPTKQSDLFPA
ncbi:MAG: Fic family protein, partial [Candidatus Brocadiae bacterium]|nr:Fic family protein [Candidatus Brocadiia bacterium]